MSHIDEDTKRRLRAMAYELDDILAEAEPTDEPKLEPKQPNDQAPRLAVIVGHTEKSPGAVAVAPISMAEYQWNSEFANYMRERAAGSELALSVFTRDKGGVRGAYARAKAWGADAAIELHFNAAGSPSATGTETIYGDKARDHAFAQVIQNAMVKTLGLRDRGVKLPWQGRGAVNLSLLSVPSVIIEPFFGSNRHDCQVMLEKWRRLAAEIVVAAKKYLLDAAVKELALEGTAT